MKVKVLKEAGYDEAMLGLSLSFNQEVDKMPYVANTLAFKGLGHNKFLEAMAVWVDITAPLYWWQQMATYRIGTSFSSESTMHTLLRHTLTDGNFEGEDTSVAMINMLNTMRSDGNLLVLKQHLPSSFLQRRIMTTNYKALQGMIQQRGTHKLPEWQLFIKAVKDGLLYSELL